MTSLFTPPQRILIASASIGGGHVAAARALESALVRRGVEVSHVDMLDYTTLPFRRLYKQTYFDLVRTAPDLVDWLGKRLDRLPSERKSRQQRVRARLTRLVSYRFPRLLEEVKPDVIVHTHFLPPEILSTLGTRLQAPQVEVITDFAAHSLWLQPNLKRYFVASDEVKVHLVSAGVDEQRVVVSGIPIDPRFEALEPKHVARAELALPEGRDTLLVMAGGLDKKMLLGVVRQLKDFRWPLTAAVLCGRSEQFVSAVQHELEEYQGLVHFRVVGLTREVPRYMAAADLVLGKPGGLTSSEALAAGLPFAVVQPYPLQEEANANYLLEHGAGMRIEPLSVLNHKLRRFFEEDERRAAMRQAALALGKPGAANAVADILLSEAL
jgi:processive 1,2-diacylglycerol beta-glucosyltransferase